MLAFDTFWVQNGFAERLIGSIRRECLDHVIVLGEAHLRRILKSYARYYNGVRTHRSSKQSYAGFSAGSAIRSHKFARHPGRASPSLPPGLSFRYTQPGILHRLDQSAFIVARRRPGLLVLNLGILQLRGVSGREPG